MSGSAGAGSGSRVAMDLLRQIESDLDNRIASLQSLNDQLLTAKKYILMMNKLEAQAKHENAVRTSGNNASTSSGEAGGSCDAVSEPLSELDALLQKAKTLKSINPESTGGSNKQGHSVKGTRSRADTSTVKSSAKTSKIGGVATAGTSSGSSSRAVGAVGCGGSLENGDGKSASADNKDMVDNTPSTKQGLFSLSEQIAYVIRFVNFTAGGGSRSVSSGGLNEHVRSTLSRFGYPHELTTAAARHSAMHPVYSTMHTARLWSAHAVLAGRCGGHADERARAISVPLEAVREYMVSTGGGKQMHMLLRGDGDHLQPCAGRLVAAVVELCDLEEQAFDRQYRQRGAPKKRQSLVERASAGAAGTGSKKATSVEADRATFSVEKTVRMWLRLHGYRELLEALIANGTRDSTNAPSSGPNSAARDLHAELVTPLLLIPLHAPSIATPGAQRNTAIARFHSDYSARTMLAVHSIIAKCCMKPMLNELKELCIETEQLQLVSSSLHPTGSNEARKRIWQPALKKFKLFRSCFLLENSDIPGSVGLIGSSLADQKLYFSLPPKES